MNQMSEKSTKSDSYHYWWHLWWPFQELLRYVTLAENVLMESCRKKGNNSTSECKNKGNYEASEENHSLYYRASRGTRVHMDRKLRDIEKSNQQDKTV